MAAETRAIIRYVIRALARPKDRTEFEVLDLADIEHASRYSLVWIDIEDEDAESRSAILSAVGLSDMTVDEWEERHLLQGVHELDDALHVQLHIPGIGGNRLVSAATDVLIGSTVLVTEHADNNPAIDRMWDPPSLTKSNLGTPAELAALVGKATGRQLIPLIDELEVRIDGLEDLAFAADPKTLTEVHALRRDLVTLRRLAGRKRDIFDDLAIVVHGAMEQRGQQAFSSASDHAGRLVDSLESARSLLNSVLETYRGAVADQTNEIVRLLTVFSAILLPLGLVAGLFGMNFVSIPGTDEDWGFWVLIGAMAVVALGLWIFFARRGFIGAPRLREVPKAVGLGIVYVGTAPVRALASGVGTTIHHIDRIVRQDQSGDDLER